MQLYNMQKIINQMIYAECSASKLKKLAMLHDYHIEVVPSSALHNGLYHLCGCTQSFVGVLVSSTHWLPMSMQVISALHAHCKDNSTT